MKRPNLRRGLLLTVCLLILAVTATLLAVNASKDVAWRVQVIGAKLSGKLPEIPATQLLRWLAPGSPVFLEPLAQAPNVHLGVLNPLNDAESSSRGGKVFGRNCVHCHGEGGRGGSGPDLISSLATMSDWTYLSTVKWGRAGTAMAAQALSDREIWETQTFLRHLKLDSMDGGKRAASVRRDTISVTPESIVRSSERPDEWLTYAGNYAGHRHTRLRQISRDNVQSLRVAWVAQLQSAEAFLETSPIVAGGLMFVTESPGGVVALDAQTGEKVWHYERPVPPNLPLCCASANRGVAILQDTIFVATLDAHLIALDASTGQEKWDVKVAESSDGYSMTGAPLALSDRVVVGISGGEYGVRGFVAAFASVDGRLLWKFNTVPGPGEPGHETWAGDSWKTGGASTWTTGAYDPELDTLFWGVGNPAPDFLSEARRGDNLYGNSVVAIDAKSGKLKWHYQFNPGGEHDWDAAQQPVLADIESQGRRRAIVLWANRNGFFYALDRRTGEFILAKPFVKQTWVAGFDRNGRPIVRPEAAPSRTGSLVWPSVGGATNWWPPSYDQHRKLLYVPAVDAASIYFRENAKFERGKLFLGGGTRLAANYPAIASIKAIEAETGDIRWEARLEHGDPQTVRRSVGGVLSTDGDLVFAGHKDQFYAFDADDGTKLWQLRVGGLVHAAPVSYSIGGNEYIAVAAGDTLFAFALPPGQADH